MQESKEGWAASSIRWAILAGLAGGTAEVAVVGAFGVTGLLTPAAVAPAIASAAGFAPEGDLIPTLVGATLHFGLAAFLGLFSGVFILARARDKGWGPASVIAGSFAILTCIWALNFLVVLPVLDPRFLLIVPPGIGLVSKLSFGAGFALVLLGASKRQARGIGRTGLAPGPVPRTPGPWLARRPRLGAFVIDSPAGVRLPGPRKV